MEQDIQLISTTDALSAVTSAEIDKQIATAHRYPRSIDSCIKNITTLALMDEETAQQCYYHLERRSAEGTTVIEGPSIRLAEIVASSWGNLRIATRVVGNDGKMVTVEGVCHDLESNVAVSQQQVRSIVTKQGYTFSNDMQVMTINAASSIAVRNAINKVIPKAITNKIVEQCKALVRGEAEGIRLAERRQKCIDKFASIGVTKEMLCAKLQIDTTDSITGDHLVSLIGIYNAIRDNASTLEEEFPKPKAENQAAASAKAAIQAYKEKKGKGSTAPKAENNKEA